MEYTIYADSDLIYNRRICNEHGEPLYPVVNPVLNETTSAFCSLTYTAKRGTPAYNKSVEMIPRIKVYEDGNLYWTGRILKTTPNINAEKQVYVEDFLGVLCDGIYRPFEWYGTVADFLQNVVDANNSQVGPNQQIYDVVCDIDEGNIVRSSEGYNTCWEIIQQKLLKMIGGYMWLTYDEQERAILHYSKNARNVSTQPISFGQNLRSYNVEYNFDGFYTACIPLGAKDKETKDYLTIASVNDGKDYLIDELNAARYGIIYAPAKVTTWEDVTIASNLLTRGQTWIQNQSARAVKKITLSAHDLSGLHVNTRPFKWLDAVPVDAAEVDGTYVIENLERPLDSPLNIDISMGATKSTLTGASVSQYENVSNRVEVIESDYTTDGDVTSKIDEANDALYNDLVTQMTSIRQEANAIISTALEEYTKTSDIETLISTIQTQITQLADSVTISFTETNSMIAANQGEAQNEFDSIYSFIRLIASGVVIGQSDSEIKLKLENDILYFFTGDETTVSTSNAIAYFASGKLYVNESQINVLTIGPEGAAMHFSIIGSGSLECLFLSPRRV